MTEESQSVVEIEWQAELASLFVATARINNREEYDVSELRSSATCNNFTLRLRHRVNPSLSVPMFDQAYIGMLNFTVCTVQLDSVTHSPGMLFDIQDNNYHKDPNNFVYLFDGNQDRIYWENQPSHARIHEFGGITSYADTRLPRPTYSWIDQPVIYDANRIYAIVVVLPPDHPLSGKPIERFTSLGSSSSWLACFIIRCDCPPPEQPRRVAELNNPPFDIDSASRYLSSEPLELQPGYRTQDSDVNLPIEGLFQFLRLGNRSTYE
ncbi:hypothetical protein JR316_0005704 [Psilocybe cubensis]|uniref:Uncharacterized protein n=2 Tax=Psilocybe cubensis TaxID=181762 RepID=A0A8H7Y015_PSICU|nr:hypothetical protein JR316_0005704 [Psilocybe cubensis]KAH9481184.1 hypothetical protein JR316_0005704 [Psilocybe cubensis]